MEATKARRALGGRVRARRVQLELSIDQAAERAGISPVTWTRVEQGKTVRELTYAAVDRALGWSEGSCVAFLQEDVEPEASATRQDHADGESGPSLLEAAGTDVFGDAMRREIAGLPPRERAEAERILDEYAKAQQRNREILGKLISIFSRRRDDADTDTDDAREPNGHTGTEHQ